MRIDYKLNDWPAGTALSELPVDPDVIKEWTDAIASRIQVEVPEGTVTVSIDLDVRVTVARPFTAEPDAPAVKDCDNTTPGG